MISEKFFVIVPVLLVLYRPSLLMWMVKSSFCWELFVAVMVGSKVGVCSGVDIQPAIRTVMKKTMSRIAIQGVVDFMVYRPVSKVTLRGLVVTLVLNPVNADDAPGYV